MDSLFGFAFLIALEMYCDIAGQPVFFKEELKRERFFKEAIPLRRVCEYLRSSNFEPTHNFFFT